MFMSQTRDQDRVLGAQTGLGPASDADMVRDNRTALILHRKQIRDQRVRDQELDAYRQHQHQTRAQSDAEDAPKTLPGMVGSDPDQQDRLQRQRQQLRTWLVQQVQDQDSETRRRRLQDQQEDQIRMDMDHKALQLQNLDLDSRRTQAVATRDQNLVQAEDTRRQRQRRHEEHETLEVQSTLSMMGEGGARDRSVHVDSPQQVSQFNLRLVEDKKRTQLEMKRADELQARARLNSARAAELMERHQVKMRTRQRRDVDRINVQLSRTHTQDVLARGAVEESFFSWFSS